jgi:selenocysteine lyase/cysteine desulfurase
MFDTINQVRNKLAKYIHSASPNDVVLVDNASHGINAVLRSLATNLLSQKNSKILYLQTAYRMVLNTLKFVHNVYDEQLLQVNITTNPSLNVRDGGAFLSFDDMVVEAVENALKAEVPGTVKLASFSHIVSLPGAVLPIKRLVQVCRKYNVQVLVDGAHALGHIHIDVQDLDPDYYVANGHKWLYSSKGSALLWVRPNRQASIYPTTISYEGQGTSNFQIGFSYQGTQDMTNFISMNTALDYNLAISGGNILANLWGTELLLPEENIGAMVDVRLPHHENKTLLRNLPEILLKNFNTWVPTYPWSGESFSNSSKNWYVRVSSQIYNEKKDFEYLGNAVLSILNGKQ